MGNKKTIYLISPNLEKDVSILLAHYSELVKSKSDKDFAKSLWKRIKTAHPVTGKLISLYALQKYYGRLLEKEYKLNSKKGGINKC